MKLRAIAITALAVIACLLPAAAFAQTAYTQDFEALAPVNGALTADGWLVYGNIFDPAGNYLWGHGPWAAPNNIGNWCDIVTGEGGGAQESQQLVMYSDYGNADHGVGNLIESNLFQEQVIPAGAAGIWYFTFDAKMGNLGGASTALAFIKTLDPNAGWAMTNFITADMTSISSMWGSYMVSIDVTGLDNQILQFGFASTASNYEPCGIFYDNVAFTSDGTVANEDLSWSDVKSLYR